MLQLYEFEVDRSSKIMARSLSNVLLKGLAAYRTSALGSRSLYQAGNRYLSSVPNDPDTHEDFRPTSKVESSGISLKDIVEQDVKDNPVMLYMKGVPDLPRCGFSSLAVRVLQEYNVPISARNILDSYELKDAVKSFSHWPTFPQIFINGEFIGGSDIILSMHQEDAVSIDIVSVEDLSRVLVGRDIADFRMIDKF
nr:monothiol glutaredoxin-S15, mitochondrial [Ipomoea batatas]